MSDPIEDAVNNAGTIPDDEPTNKERRQSAKGNRQPQQPKQADLLVKMASELDLYHSPDGTAFADIEISGHRETLPLRMKGFRRWLAHRFYLETQGAPNAEAMQAALHVIEARAHFDGEERTVHVRVSSAGEKIYIDLGDNLWRAIEIDAAGWRINPCPPVRFRRASGMQSLPQPTRGGSVKELRPFLNVPSDDQFVLAVAWLLAAMRNCGPYPVLDLAGEQGSAKSTLSKLLRMLIDPNTAPLRALPREDRDLFIAANNGHVLVFDNVSGLPFWISDTLCRLATGGGFSVRQLYTDQDEVLFDAQRPVILNGIEEVITRPDLADRSLFLTLDPIPKSKRRPEREIMAKFEAARSKIVGGLLDVMVRGLKHLPDTELDELPRMADFALWITACEAGLWEKGTFIKAYAGNIDEAVQTLIEGDIVAAAIMELMEGVTVWTGLMKDLLGALDLRVGESGMKRKEWPKTPRALSGALTRLAPSFRRVGLEVRKLRRDRMGRHLQLEWIGKRPSQPPRPSGHQDSQRFSGNLGDDWCDARDGQPSDPNPWKSNGRDDGDGRDGHLHTHSGNGAGMPCAHCGRQAEEGNPVMPTVVSDDGEKLPLHIDCRADWFEQRANQ